MFKIILFVTAVLLLYGFYLTKSGQAASADAAVKIICERIKSCARWINERLEIEALRSMTYSLEHDMRPYAATMKTQKICQYAKFIVPFHVNHDVLGLKFEVIKITPSNLEDLEGTRNMLCAMLRDFYIEKNGLSNIPAFCISSFQGNELIFWVAKNQYGDRYIEQRLIDDSNKGRPIDKEYTDD